MCHVEVVQQVGLQRSNESFGAAMLETDTVVNSSVIHERADMAADLGDSPYRRFTVLHFAQVGADYMNGRATGAKLVSELSGSGLVTIDDHRKRAFGGAFAHDRGANSFSTTGNDDHASCKFEVHAALTI
jgi:hypothetical protein